MAAIEEYTTTVVGAYSLPRWYEKLVEAGDLDVEDMRDAQWRCTQAARRSTGPVPRLPARRTERAEEQEAGLGSHR